MSQASPDPAMPHEPLSGPTNARIAAVLREIADLLDIKAESSYKVIAYRRAADSVARCPVSVADAYRAGRPPRLAGVGASLSARIDELVRTGAMGHHEQLRAEVPPSLMALLAIPGVGPRTAGEVWRGLGITSTAELEAAARAGRLRSLRGISARTEERIVAGIGELVRRPARRLLMGDAAELADRVVAWIGGIEGVTGAVIAGSVRRRTETVGDLDVLVETERPGDVLAAILAAPMVEALDVAGGARDRATVQLQDGPSLDVMVAPPGRRGSYLVHFTGSAEHNVRLRQRARQRGWSLSERGFSRLAEGDAAAPDGTPDEVALEPELVAMPTESAVYDFLGLPFIEPELREDAGELEAAERGSLPRLVARADLRGDCHSHSDWSDGREPLEVMVDSARRIGHQYLVLTDHSESLGVANGLSPQRVEQQRRVIGELNERFAREVASGQAPAGSDPDFRLLHGCELEITADGRLDYADALLARFDVVVASLHVGRRQPRERLMARYELAMRSPHVDIVSHPSGRKIGQRPDLDLDWEAFYRWAAESRTLLEVNGSQNRLDLDEHRIRAAAAEGCRFSIDSDAHDRTEWRNLEHGCAIARRGWLQPGQVANTLPLERFLRVVADKPAAW